MNWDSLFAERTQEMKRSTVREILKLTAKPGSHFVRGWAACAGTVPGRAHPAGDRYRAGGTRARSACNTAPAKGCPNCASLIAKRLSSRQVPDSAPDNILITSGSQQGLDMLARIFLNEGDRVIVENPTYVGMMTSWRPYHLRLLGCADRQGRHVGRRYSNRCCNDKHKLMYAIPTFQNPQGTTLSRERRAKLAQTSGRNNLPFVEDDPYGELRYSGEPCRPCCKWKPNIAARPTLDGNVIYCGTFSKMLTPGLRIGWVAAAFPVIDKLVQVKQATDLHTSTLNQFITYEVARDEAFLNEHIAMLREVYRERRDLMLETMDEHFPQEVTWTRPEGGLFRW